MKPASLSLTLLAATLFTTPLAQADAAADREARRRETLAKYDKNGDGRIDDAERAAGREAMRSGDGGTKREERKNLLVEHFDKNGDGRLDDAERAAAREAKQKRQQKSQPSAAEKNYSDTPMMTE